MDTENRLHADMPLPAYAVTASGSSLDPRISQKTPSCKQLAILGALCVFAVDSASVR